MFSFALCVLCVIFSLLLIKCTTSVINFASSGNCSVCYVCVCVCASYATTALATTITITTTTPRGVKRDVSPNHSGKECEAGKGEKQTKQIEIEMKIEYNKYENCTAQRRLRVKAARVTMLLRSCARDATSRLLSLPALPARCIHS